MICSDYFLFFSWNGDGFDSPQGHPRSKLRWNEKTKRVHETAARVPTLRYLMVNAIAEYVFKGETRIGHSELRASRDS